MAQETQKQNFKADGGNERVWITIDGFYIGYETPYFADLIRETPAYKEALRMRANQEAIIEGASGQ